MKYDFPNYSLFDKLFDKLRILSLLQIGNRSLYWQNIFSYIDDEQFIYNNQAFDNAFFLYEEISFFTFSTIKSCSDCKFCFDFLKYSEIISPSNYLPPSLCYGLSILYSFSCLEQLSLF